MEHIPFHLRIQMSIESIVLHKKKIGWNKIHHDIRSSTLYIKQTPYIYDSSIHYETILRINTSVYFQNHRKYIWLKNAKLNI